MGPMRESKPGGSLPSDHWIHKAMAKETARAAKKAAMRGGSTDGAKPQTMTARGPMAAAPASGGWDGGAKC